MQPNANWLSVSGIIALIVLLVAILGLLSLVPLSSIVVFGSLAGLAVAIILGRVLA